MAIVKDNLSAYLAEKQFIIRGQGVNTQLGWLPSRVVQFKLNLRYLDQQNTYGEMPEGESQIKESGLEVNISKNTNTQLLASATYKNIAFEGNRSSPAGYALLEALQPGNNWVWRTQLQQKLMQGLFLQLQYNGRKSETSRAIHNGSMSVRALF